MSRGELLFTWFDRRFPVVKTWNEHLAKYYAPKNFNFWYYFGFSFKCEVRKFA